MKRLLVAFGGLVLLLIAVIWGCAEQRIVTVPAPGTVVEEGGVAITPAPAETPAAVTAPAKAKAKIAPLYEKEISPLKTEQCGQCHLYYYNTIRNEGGKHQIDCTKCHEKYHVYRPDKVKYEDIMPKCNTCHGLAHGDKLANCAACHANPHAPMVKMAGPDMDAGCSACHGKVADELKIHKSKHTDVACSDCHTVHRHIPVCADCHSPHTPTQTNAECLSCHPVHRPLVITYPLETPRDTCGACHPKALQDLQKSQTKHDQLSCAKCHPKHRDIIQCEACHGQPHSPTLLKGFKKCGDCHNTAHAMPK